MNAEWLEERQADLELIRSEIRERLRNVDEEDRDDWQMIFALEAQAEVMGKEVAGGMKMFAYLDQRQATLGEDQ
jgi:hypothetical protein